MWVCLLSELELVTLNFFTCKFSCVELVHPEIFVTFCLDTLYSNCSWWMYHTEISVLPADKSQICHNFSNQLYRKELAYPLRV